MGTGTFSARSHATFSKKRLQTASGTTRSAREIYSTSLNTALDPAKIDVRESRDSSDNPRSTAVIIGCDVTGSMGRLLQVAITSLGTLVTEMYDRKPITDPHIMFMGIGDHLCDSAPLQVTQFEADNRIAEQLTNLWLEHGGGGNGEESYTLPWWFAATKTSIDCFEKRQKKGYLFTIGDDGINKMLYKDELARVGITIDKDYTAEELFEMVSEKYEVYHLVLQQGYNIYRGDGDSRVVRSWTDVIGERAIRVSDITKLPQIIISAIQMNEGISREDIIASWSDDDKDAISHSIGINLRR